MYPRELVACSFLIVENILHFLYDFAVGHLLEVGMFGETVFGKDSTHLRKLAFFFR